MDALPGWFQHLGEIILGTAIAFVGWVMKTFTNRYIIAMDDLSNRLNLLSVDLAELRVEVRLLREHDASANERLTRLEGLE